MAKTKISFKKWLGYAAQAAVIYPVYGLLVALPWRWSSSIGGAVARSIGPKLKVSRIAERNLQAVYPEWSAERRQECIKDVWNNLGRTVTELPQTHRLIVGKDITVSGAEYLKTDKPILFFSAHLGNWEVLATAAVHHGKPFHRVFRKANNPLVNWLVQGRRDNSSGGFIPKGAAGAKQILKALKRGENVAMLLDQKLNDGIESTFFGRKAMSAPAAANLAHRTGCVLIPAYVTRLETRHPAFHIEVQSSLALGETVADTVQRINDNIEQAVRRNPDQWLWLHRRFRDVDYKKSVSQ